MVHTFPYTFSLSQNLVSLVVNILVSLPPYTYESQKSTIIFLDWAWVEYWRTGAWEGSSDTLSRPFIWRIRLESIGFCFTENLALLEELLDTL